MRNKITDNNHLQELLLVVNLVKSRLTSLKYYLHHSPRVLMFFYWYVYK